MGPTGYPFLVCSGSRGGGGNVDRETGVSWVNRSRRAEAWARAGSEARAAGAGGLWPGRVVGIVAPILVILSSGALGCTAKRVMMPARLPAYATSPADFGDVTLVLRELSVAGRSNTDTPAAVDALRRPLLDVATRFNRFASVVDGQAAPAELAGPTVVLDVDVHVAHTSNHTYILDLFFFYPMTGYFPLTPWWGTATVTARAYLFAPGGGEIWRTKQKGQHPYSMFFYSWYRAAPIEAAYGEAYAQAFERIMTDLAGAHATIVAALPAGGRPVVQTGVSYRTQGGPSEKLAVLPTRLEAGTEGSVPELFDDYVLTSVHHAGNFDVIGKTDLDALIDFDQQKELLGCDDVSCFAELGGALGVDLLLSLSIARIGGDWVITAKLINQGKVRVEARANVIVTGEVRQLMEAIPGLLQKLMSSRSVVEPAS